jgi:hypothetical protein
LSRRSAVTTIRKIINGEKSCLSLCLIKHDAVKTYGLWKHGSSHFYPR